MIIVKVLVILCLIMVVIHTFIGLYIMITDKIKLKKQNKLNNSKITCIHTVDDCENCISQAGCKNKETNLVN